MSINFSGYVADQSIAILDDRIEISIYDLVNENEVIQLNSPRFSGVGENIKLEFLDSGFQMKGVKKKYSIDVYRAGLFDAEVNGQTKTKHFVAAYKVGKPGSSFDTSKTDF